MKKRGSKFIELPTFGAEILDAQEDSVSVRSSLSKKSSPRAEEAKQTTPTARQRTVTDDLCVRNELKKEQYTDLEDTCMNKSDKKAHSQISNRTQSTFNENELD